jgi:hypothetical protein
MKAFLGVAAVLAWLIGTMLVLAPGPFFAPLGLDMNDKVATIAQAQGATLIGLGVINWMSRKAEGRGLLAVLAGNTIVQALNLLVAFRVASLAPKAAGAILIHALLGGFFAYFLWKTQRHGVAG